MVGLVLVRMNSNRKPTTMARESRGVLVYGLLDIEKCAPLFWCELLFVFLSGSALWTRKMCAQCHETGPKVKSQKAAFDGTK